MTKYDLQKLTDLVTEINTSQYDPLIVRDQLARLAEMVEKLAFSFTKEHLK